ncbi:MAG: hypothetical protein F6K39_37920 [Okeania sp. SIO3B3]|nr:hypothetical protein [Okeania sp. SIO3B3]
MDVGNCYGRRKKEEGRRKNLAMFANCSGTVVVALGRVPQDDRLLLLHQKSRKNHF